MAIVIRPCRPDEGPARLHLWDHADASPSPTHTAEQLDEPDPMIRYVQKVDSTRRPS